MNIDSNIILNECKKIENFLNSDLLKRFGKLHNIKDQYNLFSLKQEVIAKNGYFLNVEKKYALYITNKEGVEVDNLYIKGLVTQRSDYPQITREYIKTLIEMMIKKDKVNWNEIIEFIDKSRKLLLEMCKNGDPKTARPVSYNKNIFEYKKVPSHIDAMNLWNKCMYNYFVKGTKGYLFKISAINEEIAPPKILDMIDEIRRYDSIAIPYEEERLPEYFIIDVKSMMNFCWEDRIKELLYPVWSLISSDGREEDVLTF